MKRALFIAGAKTGPELRAGADDCRKIYGTLTQDRFGGFEGTMSTPLLAECDTVSEYLAALNQFLKISANADQRIIYFTGHGRIQHGAYGFVFGNDYLPFSAVTGMLEGRAPARALFILDTCHSGAAELGGVKTEALPINGAGSGIFASSRDVQLSHEAKEIGSLFTHYLCECITSGNGGARTTGGLITIPDAAAFIRRRIAEAGEGTQNPLYSIKKAEGQPWIALNISGAAEVSTVSGSAMSDDAMGEICRGATFEDFDVDLLTAYARDHVEGDLTTVEAIAERLDLCPPGHKGAPSKAAVLCFGRKPSRYFPNSASTFAAGNLTEDGFQRSQVEGPLLRQLQQLVKLTSRELRNLAFFDDEQVRTDRPEISTTVLREVIANALAHRDFEANGRVQVRVDPEYVQVSNPGHVPKGHSWTEMLGRPGLSLTANRRLANLLQASGGYEGVGRGFSVLNAFMRERGEDAVVFEQQGGIVVCKLRRLPDNGIAVLDQAREDRVDRIVSQRAETLAYHKGLFDPDTVRMLADSQAAMPDHYAALLDELVRTSQEPGAAIALTGEAGSGKTHLLRNLYTELAALGQRPDVSARNPKVRRVIPLFASLRDLNGDLPLLAAMSTAIAVDPPLIEYIFAQHDPVLLLDGLDECEPVARASLLRSIRQARALYPHLSTIVTSRPMEGPILDGGERALRMGRLSKADVRRIIEAETEPKIADRIGALLTEYDPEFISNPLLLRLSLFAITHHAEGPRTVDQLIATAADLLWTRHDSTKAHFIRKRRANLDVNTERRLLEWLAIFVITRASHTVETFAALKFLKNALRLEGLMSSSGAPIRAEDVLDDFAETGFLAFEGNEVAFAHRSFLEHFALRGLSQLSPDAKNVARVAATLLARGVDAERLASAVADWPALEDQHEALVAAISDIRPREPTLLTQLRELEAKIAAIAAERRGRHDRFSELFEF